MPKVSTVTDWQSESGWTDGLRPERVPHTGDGGFVGHRRRTGRGDGRSGGGGGHLRPAGRQAPEVTGECKEYTPDSRMWVVDLADGKEVDQLAVT